MTKKRFQKLVMAAKRRPKAYHVPPPSYDGFLYALSKSNGPIKSYQDIWNVARVYYSTPFIALPER